MSCHHHRSGNRSPPTRQPRIKPARRGFAVVPGREQSERQQSHQRGRGSTDTRSYFPLPASQSASSRLTWETKQRKAQAIKGMSRPSPRRTPPPTRRAGERPRASITMPAIAERGTVQQRTRFVRRPQWIIGLNGHNQQGPEAERVGRVSIYRQQRRGHRRSRKQGSQLGSTKNCSRLTPAVSAEWRAPAPAAPSRVADLSPDTRERDGVVSRWLYIATARAYTEQGRRKDEGSRRTRARRREREREREREIHSYFRLNARGSHSLH